MKIPKVHLVPKNFPPIIRRKTAIGIWIYLALFIPVIIIYATTEYPRTKFSPFTKIADFALLVQIGFAIALVGWFVGIFFWCVKVANCLIRKGGTGCVHCAYHMDPSVSRGLCPECGQLYDRKDAVMRWSAVSPQLARRVLGPHTTQKGVSTAESRATE